MSIVHNNKIFKDRRRELRQRSTEVEKILWLSLRNGKLGYKFKRQPSIGGYILDFYCAESRLIVELDGSSHENSDSKLYDQTRDKYSKELDYKTLRFSNYEIKNNLESVLNTIEKYLGPSPLQGEGKGVR